MKKCTLCAWAMAVFALFGLAASESYAATATVREPAWGLPHVYADTDLALARESGREVTKDRLGQLILLSRVGRGNLYQAFGLLDVSTLDGDIETRRTQYTSSELNRMYQVLPQRVRDLILEYCKGVNDTIDQVYAGSSAEPIEVNLLRNVLGLGDDLFGNKTNISDQIDPFYAPAGGSWPNGGFQFTPEMFVSIAVLQVRQFGLNDFNEESRLSELLKLQDAHGATNGEEIWRDLNFLNDPLAPVSVPDATTPGFGGPLARLSTPAEVMLACLPAEAAPSLTERAASEPPHVALAKGGKHRAPKDEPVQVASAKHWPDRDYAAGSEKRDEILARRADLAKRLGAWPMLGSYSWVIAANKSATGKPWLGGFPQTGIQTPSVMHFMELRSGEEIHGMGMEFAGAPAVLIGQTDTMAWTSTTAQLRIIDTFLEEIVNEDVDALRYNAEGTNKPLSSRQETFPNTFVGTHVRTFWRSHETNGNGGTRPIVDFTGDAEGTAEGGTIFVLQDNEASFGAAFINGYVAIVDGQGAGQIRQIASVPDGQQLQVNTAWTTTPSASSVYVAVEAGGTIMAVAEDSGAWLEESTTALGFAFLQEAEDVLGVRAAVRLMPSTHNFPSIDNQAFNGVGTNGGSGNIAYYSSGFSRKRQGSEDKLLPLDGTLANPLAVVTGTVSAAAATTLSSTGAFTGEDFSPPAINFRYLNPTQQGSEYVVSITSGTGERQTRRIASNDDDTLTVEYDWGVVPDPGDTFEVYEIVAMPEVVNPSEGYTANWNNKAATADDGDHFGRNHRVAFILERLAAENLWDREKQRQLNKDVAGLDGKGKYGRYLVPRLRQAIDALGASGEVKKIVKQLEDHNDAPAFGRRFIDPVLDTTQFGEEIFLESLIVQLANDIYGDEFTGSVSVPGGSDGLALVVHAIDSAAGDVPGSYAQEYSGDYFNGAQWETVVRDALETLAGGGIPADIARFKSTYNHPLAALFDELRFDATPEGNRGTWEQIVEAGTVVKGEFMFPLGQSGLVEGSLSAVTSIDPNVTSLQPVWRDWRFLPMLHVGEDLAGGNPDNDGDGVLDAFERWYFGDLTRTAANDDDADGLQLLDEYLKGTDPTDADTDDDRTKDGTDPVPQDRLLPPFLRGLIKIGDDPSTDFLKIKLKIEGLTPPIDPNTEDITLTLTDNDQIYSVTIPNGTLPVKSPGKKWKLKDTTATVVPGLTKVVVVAGKAGGSTKIIINTDKTRDLSDADLNDHNIKVAVKIENRTIADTRLWELKGANKLKATK